MSKRGADNYLTDQNWDNDDDDEHQEAGTFTSASESVMQSRQVKKAKRRGTGEDSGTSSESAGAFKGFAGFAATAKSAAPSFTFGGFSGGSGSAANGATASAVATKPTDSVSPTKAKLSNGTSKSPSNKTKYMTQLKTLNEGVMTWIKQHVDSNPYCILSPIFTDYEKYLKEIEQKYPYKEEKAPSEEKEKAKEDSKEEEKEKGEEKEEEKDEKKEKKPATTFGGSSAGIFGSASTSSVAATGFTFGSAASSSTSAFSNTTTTTATTSSFSFSKETAGDTAAKPAFGGFNFGSSGSLGGTSGFSFATAKPGGSEDKGSGAENTEDDEYVPPKDEVKEVKEDAYYTKRCKLFFKKGESWTEKGIGNLHLKDCDGKTQMLIRADTNLGNILLNIMVSSAIPCSRQGKNNVALICVPNPPLNEKAADDKAPVSMLIRVKTADDADELFEKLQAAKNK